MTVESPTGKASANWDVYGTPDKPVAKNVILLIADGLEHGPPHERPASCPKA